MEIGFGFMSNSKMLYTYSELSSRKMNICHKITKFLHVNKVSYDMEFNTVICETLDELKRR